MKRLLPVFFITLLFAACNNQTATTPSLSLDCTTITAPAKGGEYSINVTTDNSWTATPGNSWVSVSPAYGNGSAVVMVKISANKEAVVDVSSVVFADAGSSTTLEITREALSYMLEVSPTQITCPKDGSVVPLLISSTIKWQVESNVSWMSVNPGVGKNNGKVDVTISPATISEVTEAKLTVSPFGSDKDVEPIVIPVLRYGTDAATLSVEPANSQIIECDAEGGDYTANINSNAAWKAETEAEWISIKNAENTGSAVLSFTVEPNPSVVSDAAVIIIREQSANKNPAELFLYVTRKAAVPVIVLSQNVFNIGKQSFVQYIDIESNADWYVRNDQSWLRLVPDKGCGNGYVWISVEKNETNVPRRAEPMFVATGEDGVTRGAVLVINQERTDPSFALSAENITTPVNGGDFSFSVFTTSAWNVSVEDYSQSRESNWLRLKTKSGNGSGVVEFSVLPPQGTSHDVSVYVVVTEDNPKTSSPVSVRCKVVRKGNSHVTKV